MMTTTATPKHKRGEEGKEKKKFCIQHVVGMNDFFLCICQRLFKNKKKTYFGFRYFERLFYGRKEVR